MEKNNPPPYSAATGYPPQPQPGEAHYPPLGDAPYPQPGGVPYPQQQPGGIPYPQQQPGFYPQPQQGQQVVMITSPPIIASFGPNSQILACPHCHKQISSRVETEAATKTHLFALILCLFGCIPCCLIPYCTDSCQNRNHYCPSCGAYLGAYSD